MIRRYECNDYDFDRFDCDRNRRCDDDYDINALNEAERVARNTMRQYCRENRCESNW